MHASDHGEVSWERITAAGQKVQRRLLCTVAVLKQASIPYAIAGDHAAAAWVARGDEAAVRNPADFEILLRREDLPATVRAMEAAGFVYRHTAGLDMFLEGTRAKARDAVHVVLAAEKVRPDYLLAAPDATESEAVPNFRLLALDALVRMKLTSFRDKDRTHVRDLIGVGLVDSTWVERLPASLRPRLQQLLDTPEG